MADSCLFCDMLEGKVPMDVVRETGLSVAIRDIDPQAPVHLLVFPRRHVENLKALAEYPEELANLVELAGSVAEEAAVDAYRLVANTGAGAGQSVFHAHLHVLGGRPLEWPPG